MNLVVLTGAGISTESGLATFRAEDGLWAGHNIEDVFTPEAFARDPDQVCQFYDERKLLAAAAKPNAAHGTLADLERLWQKELRGDFLFITQNVDDLHERAGSRNLINMHGKLNSAYYTDCGYQGPRFGPLDDDRECPSCQREMLHPYFIFSGEIPRGQPKIDEPFRVCDVFVAIGTFGQVYPAPGFVQVAKSYGTQTVLLNLDMPADGGDFDICQTGYATEVIPQ